MIPDGWQEVPLGTVAEFVNGRPFKPYEWADTGLPIIRIQNLNGSTDYNYYNGEFEEKVLIRDGDLLFAWSGSRGTSFGPHIWRGRQGLLNYHTWKVNPSNEVDKQFLYFALQQVTAVVEHEAHGAAALVHTQKNRIVDYRTFLPPFPEQRKIAAILSTWDEAIALTERLIAALEQRKRGLMQRLLSGAVRFPGFTDEWRLYRFGGLFERVTRKNSDGNTNVLTMSAQYGLVNQKEFFNKIVAGASIENNYLLRRGEFAYNRSYSAGYPLGAIKRLDRYGAGVLSTLYICFRIRDEKETDPNFCAFFFDAGGMNRAIYEIAQEGARNHGLLNVGVSDFFDIQVRLPSPEEQRKVAEILSIADQAVEGQKRRLEALKLQKKGLMQRLLTGEVRVKVDE